MYNGLNIKKDQFSELIHSVEDNNNNNNNTIMGFVQKSRCIDIDKYFSVSCSHGINVPIQQTCVLFTSQN